jgi:hypothetical protein
MEKRALGGTLSLIRKKFVESVLDAYLCDPIQNKVC